jgi:hypothetical protein
MIQKCKECQGNEANHSRRTLVIVASSLKMVSRKKIKNESRRRYFFTHTSSPYILVCNRVFVGSIVNRSIIEQLFPDYFGRIKVHAEKISRTFQFSFLGFRDDETGRRDWGRPAAVLLRPIYSIGFKSR